MIVATLKLTGVPESQTDIELEPFALKNKPASATWYYDGHRMYLSYDGCGKYVENLYVVSQVIEKEVQLFLTKEKTQEEFIHAFSEDDDVEKQRKEARKVLGVEEDCKDLEVINKKYKDLAKIYHPDTGTGDVEKFKEINKAHKMLKRELT